MADIKQDLLGLKYSQNFSIQGMQEADIDLNLTPRHRPALQPFTAPSQTAKSLSQMQL